MSWWFHVAWFWEAAKVIYDFRWCHDDFMWHEFGRPPMSYMTLDDVMMISYDIVLAPNDKSYMISYDFRLNHIWLCVEGRQNDVMWSHHDIIMTSCCADFELRPGGLEWMPGGLEAPESLKPGGLEARGRLEAERLDLEGWEPRVWRPRAWRPGGWRPQA